MVRYYIIGTYITKIERFNTQKARNIELVINDRLRGSTSDWQAQLLRASQAIYSDNGTLIGLAEDAGRAAA